VKIGTALAVKGVVLSAKDGPYVPGLRISRVINDREKVALLELNYSPGQTGIS